LTSTHHISLAQGVFGDQSIFNINNQSQLLASLNIKPLFFCAFFLFLALFGEKLIETKAYLRVVIHHVVCGIQSAGKAANQSFHVLWTGPDSFSSPRSFQSKSHERMEGGSQGTWSIVFDILESDRICISFSFYLLEQHK